MRRLFGIAAAAALSACSATASLSDADRYVAAVKDAAWASPEKVLPLRPLPVGDSVTVVSWTGTRDPLACADGNCPVPRAGATRDGDRTWVTLADEVRERCKSWGLSGAALTRRLEQVLDGIMAAKAAGLHIKINAVALKGVNEDEYDRMVEWCGGHGFDLCLIETMPLGEIHTDRTEQYLPLSTVRARLEQSWNLEPSDYRTGGPARYWRVGETGGRVGFITPMTHNFCESCNRVRVTCTGTLYMCLGQEDAVDLRAPLRASEGDHLLEAAIDSAIARKPKGHDFIIDRGAAPALGRHMSVTGG